MIDTRIDNNMNFSDKIGLKVGGIIGALISLALIYHGKKVFPELLNSLIVAFLPWIGAALGDKYIKQAGPKA